MLRRITSLKGLNLRESDINRPPEFAQDCRNVEKNSKGEVVLRWGYDKINSEPDIIDLFEYVGAKDDPDRGALLALKSTAYDNTDENTQRTTGPGLYRLNGSSFEKIPWGNIDTTQPTWTAQTKTVEYNKVLYWNDPDFNIDLWKFDGYHQYRAGVPKPKVNSFTFSGSGNFFFRVILKYSDPQGNVTYSDYEQYSGTGDNIQLTMAPITDSYYDGFYQRYARTSTPIQLIGNGVAPESLTLNVDDNNIVAGSYMMLPRNVTDTFGFVSTVFDMVRVASRTATTITFDSASVGDKVYTVTNTGLAGKSVEGRYELLIYRSSNEFTNYIKMDTNLESYSLGAETSPFSFVSTAPTEENLGEVYDDSLVRVLPPKGKYLTLYNEFMVIGNLGPVQPDFGFAALLGNDTRLEDAIVWSDISTLSNGSSIETFLVNNIRSVGDSADGAVSAVAGNDDNLVVHKEKQSYYLNGDLINNTLRVRRAMTEQVGAASHRSIRTVEGGHLYVSPKGVYLSVGGQKPRELSDLIEPLFTDNALELSELDTENSKTITDFLREKMYIFIPYVSGGGIVLSYDYYHMDWFLHDNIPANNGFQDVGITSTDIYFADSTGLYKRNLNTNKDNNKKTIGYYWTGWFDLDAPSIVKKFVNFIMLSIAKKSFTATIKGYCNWQNDTEESSNTIEFTDKISSEDTQVLQVQANSVSFRISNEQSGGDLHITSYEVEYEPTQTKPKGTV